MAKPFKLATSTPPRDSSGRFTQPIPPAPPQVADEARRDGTSADVAANEVAVADHPTPGSAKRGEEIPWPKAGPVNDAGNKPMRVS